MSSTRRTNPSSAKAFNLQQEAAVAVQQHEAAEAVQCEAAEAVQYEAAEAVQWYEAAEAAAAAAEAAAGEAGGDPAGYGRHWAGSLSANNRYVSSTSQGDSDADDWPTIQARPFSRLHRYGKKEAKERNASHTTISRSSRLMSAFGRKADTDLLVSAQAAERHFRMETLVKPRSEKLDCNQVNGLAGAVGFEPPNHGIKIRPLLF